MENFSTIAGTANVAPYDCNGIGYSMQRFVW